MEENVDQNQQQQTEQPEQKAEVNICNWIFRFIFKKWFSSIKKTETFY